MWLYWVTYFAGQALRPYWRLSLVGDKRAIPRTGPLLLASNHASYLDPWLLGFAFPRAIRFLIAREWYFRSRSWNLVFRANGTIPVGDSPSRTLDAVCDALGRGETVAIFPEGRISHDGRIQPFRAGLAHIAARTGSPVLPLGIRGNFRSMPRHRRWPSPSTIKVHVGSPITFPGAPVAGLPARETSESFQAEIVRRVCLLAGQDGRADEILGPKRPRSTAAPRKTSSTTTIPSP
jgi:1-acyl-sn-glycerol-3-phosphate acyltransferase